MEERGASLIIPIMLGGRRILGIVDSAAQVTVINEQVASRAGLCVEAGVRVNLRTADGNRMPSKMVEGVSLGIGEGVYEWPVYVAQIKDEFILGLDFLKHHRAVLDLDGGTVLLKNQHVKAQYCRNEEGQQYKVSRVYLTRSVTVLPNSIRRVFCKLDGDLRGVICIDSEKDQSGVLVPNMLTEVEKTGEVVVTLRNNSMKGIRVHRGCLIGVATSAVIEKEGRISHEGVPAEMVLSEGKGDFSSGAGNQFTVCRTMLGESQDLWDKVMQSLPEHIRKLCDEVRGRYRWSDRQLSSLMALVSRVGTHISNGTGDKAGEFVQLLSAEIDDSLRDMFKRSCEKLTSGEATLFCWLILSYQNVFAKHDYDLGCYQGLKHKIDTGDAQPIKKRLRRTPMAFEKEEEEHIQKMLDLGVIRASKSEWAFPPVLVRKKDGTLRWCLDYRDLNAVTRKDAYQIPRVSQCVDFLSNYEFLSCLDMFSGYWQC